MRDIMSGLIDVELRPKSGQTLTRQLYDQLREAILSDRLPAGHSLPSSRDLAGRLGVSRNVVTSVIEQLAMEGYLDTAQGRRSVVAATPDTTLMRDRSSRRLQPREQRLSYWAKHLSKAEWPFINEGAPRPFLPGIADAREFPHEIWARCLRRTARNASFGNSYTLNRPTLQEALLRHLVEHRGVRSEAHQLLIMPSAQAAIGLIAKVLLNPGDLAWIESPGYGGARVALESAGAIVQGVRLDRSGLSIDGSTSTPRLIFVTPSHQYPTGRLMPIARRQELLAFAASTGAAIIEDDYDSEFQYDGRPVAALQCLDGSESIFYVGTFSKAMFAGVRAGYAIVPNSLVEIFERAQRHSGQFVLASLQDALADFVNDGYFAAHIRKMTRIYHARRDWLIEALCSTEDTELKVDPPTGGMQLLASLTSRRDDEKITQRLADAGVTVRPLSRHFTGEITEWGLFLGFAAWNRQEIDAASHIMKKIIRSP